MQLGIMQQEIDYKSLYTYGIIGNWYLRKTQLELYKLLRSGKSRVVIKTNRRFGKTTSVFTYIFERCHTEKIIVRYGAPTQKQAREISSFLIGEIYSKCPEKKPILQNGAYVWQETGSIMHLFGDADSKEIDSARGPQANIIYADEFGFMKHKPSYLLRDVLQPQLDTIDNGQMIITSTPPEDLSHPYKNEVENAAVGNYLFDFNIDDWLESGEINQDYYNKRIEQCGGIESDSFKREYRCIMIPNKSRLVIPEGQNTDLYIGSQPRPRYCNKAAMFDFGFHDFTAGLWGYVDFDHSKLIIETELWLNYSSTREITEEAKRIEQDLEYNKIVRKGDCADAQQLYDMSKDHGYQIHPISKRSNQSNVGFRDSVINQLRLAIANQKIIINPDSCPRLVSQIKYGIWNERRTDFERSETMGHLDLLITLAYFNDNAPWNDNPYPLLADGISSSTHFIPTELTNRRAGMAKMMGRKR